VNDTMWSSAGLEVRADGSGHLRGSVALSSLGDITGNWFELGLEQSVPSTYLRQKCRKVIKFSW